MTFLMDAVDHEYGRGWGGKLDGLYRRQQKFVSRSIFSTSRASAHEQLHFLVSNRKSCNSKSQ